MELFFKTTEKDDGGLPPEPTEISPEYQESGRYIVAVDPGIAESSEPAERDESRILLETPEGRQELGRRFAADINSRMHESPARRVLQVADGSYDVIVSAGNLPWTATREHPEPFQLPQWVSSGDLGITLPPHVNITCAQVSLNKIKICWDQEVKIAEEKLVAGTLAAEAKLLTTILDTAIPEASRIEIVTEDIPGTLEKLVKERPEKTQSLLCGSRPFFPLWKMAGQPSYEHSGGRFGFLLEDLFVPQVVGFNSLLWTEKEIIPSNVVYLLPEPELLGVISPARDVNVGVADDPRNLKLGWVAQDFAPCAVLHPELALRVTIVGKEGGSNV